jgi:hypothetical protein
MRTASFDFRVRLACAAILIGAAIPGAAFAQAAGGSGSRWTLEVYGGASSSAESTSGSAGAAFPAGTPFTTAGSVPSRIHTSWYFGDGTTLMNQALAQFEIIQGATFTRIVPLDSAVFASATRRNSGATFGLRVSRSLSSRFALEASVERNQGSQEFTDSAAKALEATRDSFQTAFQGLLATAPLTTLSVSSMMTARDSSSGQTRVAAAARWTVVSGSRTSVYATAGAGVVMNGSDDVQAVLTGTYSFRLYGAFPMSETDRAVVTVSAPSTAAVGLLGGGVTYDLSARVGLRADVRVSLSSNSSVTTVSGSPSVATQTPANVLPSLTSPGIQFSSTAGVPSSLSGAAATYTTFSGSGMNRHVSFTVGIFRRF